MRFVETELAGAYVIEPEYLEDERGFFARTFCEREFAERGLEMRFVQCSISFNRLKGTLRGMHYQAPPHGEVKIVRCTSGAIYDVIVDLRQDSPTFKNWIGIELSADNRHALYVPKGFAHGFQTLEENSEVFYQISVEYNRSSSRGLQYDDPGLAITWPLPVMMVSKQDRMLPPYFSA